MNIVSKVTGDSLNANEFNQIPDEMKNLITTGGMSPSDLDLQQTTKAIAQYCADGNFYVASGTANAIILNTNGTRIPPVALSNGFKARFKAFADNTGNCTINVANFGTKSIYFEGNQLQAGEIKTGKFYEVVYDSNNDYFVIKKDIYPNIKSYDVLSSLIADTTIKNGDLCITSGYNSINDGGQGIYIIRPQTVSDVDNGGTIIIISNNLVAELLIFNNTINIKQLGATTDSDIKPYIEKYIDILDDINGLELYIPSGLWLCSELNITRYSGFVIKGDKSFYVTANDIYEHGTVITSLNDNQDYVFKIGDASTDKHLFNFRLDNLTFSSSWKQINVGCLVISYAEFGYVNVDFRNIKGTALHLNDCWEIYFGDINFRGISDFSKSVFVFGTRQSSNVNSNISAIIIKSLMFEACDSNCIEVQNNSQVMGLNIGHIDWEASFSGRTTNVDGTLTDLSLIYVIGEFENATIGSIGAQHLGASATYNGNTYYHNNVIKCKTGTSSDTNAFLLLQVSAINVYHYTSSCHIFNSTGGVVNRRTKVIIDSILYYDETSSFPLPIYVENFTRLIIGSHIQLLQDYCVEPVYKHRRDNQAVTKFGSLTSDSASYNTLKLVVKRTLENDDQWVLPFINKAGHTLSVRVYAPVGNWNLALTGTGVVYTLISFTSTGVWQWVDIPTSSLTDGIECLLGEDLTTSRNNGDRVSFDAFRWK